MHEIKARLRELGLENEFGYRKEVRRLPECLHAREAFRAITSGLHEGARWFVVATDRRVLLAAKPTMGDLRLVELEPVEIRDVTHKKGLLFATLTITTNQREYTFSNVLKKSLPSFLTALSEIRGPDATAPE